jgi:hypothetical protein
MTPAYATALWKVSTDQPMPTRELNAFMARHGKTSRQFHADVDAFCDDPAAFGWAGLPADDKKLRIHFDHGLGDCCQFAAMCQLWKSRGFDVEVSGRDDCRWLWTAAGLTAADWTPYFATHPWIYPREFGRLDQPDWRANKTAFNLTEKPLPPIGAKDALWRELVATRLDARPMVSSEAMSTAAEFLGRLPRPIVAIHATGNCWRDRKSIPTEAVGRVQRRLVDRGCGVVILEWDRRTNVLACPSVKEWDRPGLDELAALLLSVDVLTGIDSGPFHFANLLPGVRCLGVFLPTLHAHQVCLPNPDAMYLVPNGRQPKSDDWRAVEYKGKAPPPERIVDECLRMI